MGEMHDDRRSRYSGRHDDERHERGLGRRPGYESEDRGRYGSERQGGRYGGQEESSRWRRGSETDWEEPGAGWSDDHPETQYGNPGYGGPRFEGGYGRGRREGAGGSEYGRHFGELARSGMAGRPAAGGGMSGGSGWFQSRMSGGGMSGKGPKGYARSDERIREQVCDCLTDDPHIDASEIEVQVKAGEVTMSGTVDSRDAKRHAEDLIEHLGGVKHVQNNLRVQEASGQTSGGRSGASR
jgi:hypothetical protein